MTARLVEVDASVPAALAKVRGPMRDFDITIARRFGWRDALQDQLPGQPTLLIPM